MCVQDNEVCTNCSDSSSKRQKMDDADVHTVEHETGHTCDPGKTQVSRKPSAIADTHGESFIEVDDSSIIATMPMVLHGCTADPTEQRCLHLHCAHLLAKHPSSRFSYSTTICADQSLVCIRMSHELAEQIPLLCTMIDAASSEKTGPEKATVKMPFQPPVAACGLVCMLMLLDAEVGVQEMFSSDCYGPSLAIQTLWVCSATHAIVCRRICCASCQV